MSEERFSHVTFLGTASAIPLPGKRNVSALAISTMQGEVFLVDCGEGTQHQIYRCSSVKMERISHVFITHLHGDHCFGIFGLLASMATSGREKSVVIVAPKGIQKMIETVYNFGGGILEDAEAKAYPLEFRELEGDQNIDLGIIGDGFRVMAHPLKHRVPTFGYTFQEPTRLGKLDGKKAASLGAVKQMLGQLKNGNDVQLPNGTTIRSADVVQPPQIGRKISVLQDTCDSRSAVENAMNCDLLIHEATYAHAMVEKAIIWGHSTAKMAGEFARQIQAKNLFLTHFSARYHAGEEVDSKGRVRDPEMSVLNLISEAAAQCPHTTVVGARDFMVVRSKGSDFRVDAQLAMKKAYRSSDDQLENVNKRKRSD
uniref:Ribonuclease Z n=2 Tax=Hirondellea gigas TaxID=1518452 RepID=A0A6A7G800_9CRUS